MRLKENIVRLKQTLAKRTQGQYVYMKQVFMYIAKMKKIPRDIEHMEVRIDEKTSSKKERQKI